MEDDGASEDDDMQDGKPANFVPAAHQCSVNVLVGFWADAAGGEEGEEEEWMEGDEEEDLEDDAMEDD